MEAERKKNDLKNTLIKLTLKPDKTITYPVVVSLQPLCKQAVNEQHQRDPWKERAGASEREHWARYLKHKLSFLISVL